MRWKASAILSKRGGWVEALRVCAIFLPLATQAGMPDLGIGIGDYVKGQDFLTQKKWADAVVSLRAYLRRNPRSTRTAIDLASALLHLGHREEAVDALRSTASLVQEPERRALLRRAGAVARIFLSAADQQSYQESLESLRMGKPRQAREKLEKLLEAEAANLDILVRLGQALALEGKGDLAMERLRAAQRIDPTAPEPRLWIGRLLHQQGRTREALKDLVESAERLRSSELAALWASESLLVNGNRAGAIAVLERAVAGQPLNLRAATASIRLRLAEIDPVTDKGKKKLAVIQAELDRIAGKAESYGSPATAASEGELGINLRDKAALAEEIAALSRRIDERGSRY